MNIFVGNLSPTTVAEGLRKLFSEFGEIASAKVIIDNATGVSRGFGFVEMTDHNAAQDAIDNLDFSYFEGNIISVKEAKQNTGKPGGGSYGGGGQRQFKPRSPRPGGGYGDRNRDGGSSYGNRNREGGSYGNSYNDRNRDGGNNYGNRDGGSNYGNREGGSNYGNREGGSNYNERGSFDRNNSDGYNNYNKNY